MNRTAVLTGPRTMEMVERPIPVIEDDELLLRIRYCGICGSDIHSFLGSNPYTTYPVVRGHEFAGEIVETGKGAVRFKPGELVTAVPISPCGRCVYCSRKDFYLCNNPGPYNGAFARYIAVKAAFAYKIPDEIDARDATLIEPLACVIHAMKNAHVAEGENIVIFGAGTIGQFINIYARSKKAGTITVTDRFEAKLDIAKRNGADRTVRVGGEMNKTGLLDLVGADKTDVVFDCVCNEQTIADGVDVLKKRGRLVYVGIPNQKPKIDLARIIRKEIMTISTFTYRDEFPEAIGFIKNHPSHAADFVTKVFPFDEIQTAFEEVTSYNDRFIKCVLTYG